MSRPNTTGVTEINNNAEEVPFKWLLYKILSASLFIHELLYLLILNT